MDPEKHCNTKLTYTLDGIRGIWSDLPDKQRMEVLKSIIWSASNMHDFYGKAMKVLGSEEFRESLD